MEEIMQARTLLVIAHPLSTITRADKIVVEEGTHQARSGRYRRMVELQMDFAEAESP
jgi:ABC-type multidrug transport system fused ATPase/permease subunit